MRTAFLAGAFLASALSAPVAAAPIDFSVSSGDPEPGAAPGFTWQGLDFVLDPQPGGSTTAAHAVAGDPDGKLDITLNAPGKVTYRAQLPELGGGPAGYRIDYQYGADLETSTPGFTFVQPFLRTFDGSAPTTALAGLYGSDQSNPGSPFTGVQGRPDTFGGSSGFSDTAFLDNVVLGDISTLDVTTNPDGMIDAIVSQNGASTGISANFTQGTDAPFFFEELLLQVGGDFGDAEFQPFTVSYLDAEIGAQSVPIPASLLMLGAGLMGLGALRRRRLG